MKALNSVKYPWERLFRSFTYLCQLLNFWKTKGFLDCHFSPQLLAKKFFLGIVAYFLKFFFAHFI